MKVFEPIEINGMKLKNRLGFPPFLNMPAGENGHINDQTVRWFEDRAKGGAGLVMSGAVIAGPAPDPGRAAATGMSWVALYDDEYIEGFARMADACHAHGAKFGVQLTGLGGPLSGRGPSLPPYPDEAHETGDMMKVMYGFEIPVTEISVEELEGVMQDIADASARAKAAGVDCVELHCAHGGATLHNSFISPYYNRRTDRYGGDWEGRLRLPVETIEKMREAVGDDYPILVRLSSTQMVGDRGVTLDDTCKIIVPALEKAGVDCFDISQGDILRANEGILIPMYYPQGCFMDFTAEVKKATKLPVIGVGRIVDIDMANRFIEEGKADLIFMGRQLTADPDTPKKYLEGRADEIRTCMGCSDTCGPCGINYEIHREFIPLTPAEEPKKVLVIGGGVGGMEAARIAALRGHDVTLMEKTSELGGIVAALARNPLTSDFGNIVEYLCTQVGKLNVAVKMGTEATVADVREMKPDVVILAAGSSMVIPEEAAGQPGVMDHVEALRRQDAIGDRVVVWGLIASDFAIALAQQGKDVVMIGRGGPETLARDYSLARKWYALRKLSDVNLPRETPEALRLSNPKVLYNTNVESIADNEITVVNGSGEKSVLPYDTLVISRESMSNDSMFEELEKAVPKAYKIGDCVKPAEIKDAIRGANEVARAI